MSYFGPSFNQMVNTLRESPCWEKACWVSIGPPAASGALCLICQIRQSAVWMKSLKPHRNKLLFFHWVFWRAIIRMPQAAFVGSPLDFQPGNITITSAVFGFNILTTDTHRENFKMKWDTDTSKHNNNTILDRTRFINLQPSIQKLWTECFHLHPGYKNISSIGHYDEFEGMKKSNKKCDTRETVPKKSLTKSEKWEVCGTGRRDTEKWDFLSASLLQFPLLQSLLAMHEWVNQTLFDFH